MSKKINGYFVMNGNTANNGYVSENDCCITNTFSSINYRASKNGYSGSYVSYKCTKHTDDIFQR
jgi:hypothetical protein